ncbi:uncharacterized protein BYT42DRAFT_85368 [Radiomyces spectabilis]|uniref:uncharacterized protein n=1 Tax=Radiomyces spectabilis TaxID=64574 RepID=UPI00221E4AB5|nr:uncharacterized protein BYT42DRAFT_85368 [Radiomyces spectabilis]KAI8370360.1 hypothetical protein BYT42DRAFT_85368 [Radiomyces spectabilis]
MAVDDPGRQLNAYSYVTLCLFLVALIPVIHPVTLRLGRRIKLRFNLATAPPLAVLILLICRAIDFDIVGKGCLGSQGVEPYAIMILFYSLAYICISIDVTGFLQFCALWASRRAGQRGLLAFFLFFLLTSVMSALTSNDVVILTGTAFLSYFTRVAGIDPTAFLLSEFTTANIASMALYIGNPTNVVVSQAYNMNFVQYSAWMLLPTVVCLLLAFIVLRVLFNNPKYLPRVIYPPDADPRRALIDPTGAVFGILCLVCCLGTLIGTSFVRSVSVWMVTLPFAVIMLARDIAYDLQLQKHYPWSPRRKSEPQLDVVHPDEALTSGSAIAMDILPDIGTSGINYRLHTEKQSRNSSVVADHVSVNGQSVLTLESGATQSHRESAPPKSWQQQHSDVPKTEGKRWPSRLLAKFNWCKSKLPTVVAVIGRMPWAVLPFSLSMFVLVEALSDTGWIGTFAIALSVFTKNYITAVYGSVAVSILVCQFLNNIPMTILFTRMIQHPNFTSRVQSDAVMQGMILGLIVGSNIGACLTIIGSLAGIMFDHILKTKGIHVLGYVRFLKWNIMILPILAVGTASVIVGELYVVFIRGL